MNHNNYNYAISHTHYTETFSLAYIQDQPTVKEIKCLLMIIIFNCKLKTVRIHCSV